MDDIYEIDEYQLNGVDIYICVCFVRHEHKLHIYMKLARATIPFVLISDETTPKYKVLIKEVFTVKINLVVL